MAVDHPLMIDFSQKNALSQILPDLPLLHSHQSSWEKIHLAHYCQPAMDLPEMCSSQHIVILPLGYGEVDLEVLSEGCLHTALYQANDYTDGCIQIIPADLPHQVRCSPQVKQVEFVHCYLEPTFLAQIAHESIDPDRVELLLELKKIDRLIQQIGLALKADLEVSRTGDGFYADSMATALSAHLLRHYSTRKYKFREHEDGLSKHKLIQAIEYINDHISENKLSLASIAAELKMSQYYFCRLFKQSMGMTPHQYLIRQRIERAKQLLKLPELTITQIAIECGFANQSHFAKYFRLKTGVSPKQFRQM